MFWHAPGNAPAAPPALTGVDEQIRLFYLSKRDEIREDLFPPVNLTPPPPPSPVTVDQRSFFRLRRTLPATDADFDGRPDVLEGSAGKLILSEVCFLKTSASSTDQIGGESADWVEIWNPTDHSVSTEGYYLADNNVTSAAALEAEMPLPLTTVGPGETLIIHCSAEGRARLAAANPRRPFTAPFDLAEDGEKIYLYKRTSPTAFTEVSQLNPPAGLTLPPNVSYGLMVTGTTLTYGWFQHPTPGAPNAGWQATAGPLGLTLIDDADSPLAAPVALRGKLFSTGVTRARLRHADPAAVLVYALNGQEPTEQSAVYDPAAPITITGTTVLRVKAMRAGALPSRTVTRTFIHIPSVPAQEVRNPAWESQSPSPSVPILLPANNPAITT